MKPGVIRAVRVDTEGRRKQSDVLFVSNVDITAKGGC